MKRVKKGENGEGGKMSEKGCKKGCKKGWKNGGKTSEKREKGGK